MIEFKSQEKFFNDLAGLTILSAIDLDAGTKIEDTMLLRLIFHGFSVISYNVNVHQHIIALLLDNVTGDC